MAKTNPILIITTFMLIASLLMLGLSYVADIDSNYDLLFETNTLVIIVYICFVARKTIQKNSKLKYGVGILLFNKMYDVITELSFLDEIADRHDLIDTFLEDGLLQISFLLIAFGLTEVTVKLKEKNAVDQLTGLYNRKKLKYIQLDEFDLIYIDLDGLKNINDQKGHSVGDLLIVRFSQVISQSIIDKEMAFRMGGDEFIITAMPGRSDELLGQVNNLLDGEPISFSYGVEATTKENFHQALDRSDKAMYEMKKSHKTHHQSL